MTFIDELEKFNRKERFFMIKHVLKNANPQTQSPQLVLDVSFIRDLISKTGCPIKYNNKQNTFWAIDFHLDWIYAALVQAYPNNNIVQRASQNCYKNKTVTVKNTNLKTKSVKQVDLISFSIQDIDLIVVIEDKDNNKNHLFLIEAKCDGSWDSDQLMTKATRLGLFFGTNNGNNWSDVKPYFATLSPNSIFKTSTVSWPKWMCPGKTPPHIPLKGFIKKGLLKVKRCSGGSKAWKIV